MIVPTGWRAGRLPRLALPYLRIVVPGLAVVAGFVGLVELLSFLTIGAEQGKREAAGLAYGRLQQLRIARQCCCVDAAGAGGAALTFAVSVRQASVLRSAMSVR